MSSASAARSRLVGLALGVVVLLALVVLAVVLPRLSGEDASAAQTSGSESVSSGSGDSGSGDAVEPTLPAAAADFALVDDPDEPGFADLRERLDSAEALLEETYQVPVSVGLYAGDGGGQDARSAVVTAASAEEGLFLPSGPAPDPALLGLERNQAELAKVGDAVCNIVYGQPVPEGQQVDDSTPPSGVQCQLTSDGVTFQVDGSAMSAQDAVALLDGLAAVQ